MRPPSSRTRRPSGWLTLILLPLLGACATTAGSVRAAPEHDYCALAFPIYVSPDDVLTDATAKAIRDTDLTGAALCGWTPKLPPNGAK